MIGGVAAGVAARTGLPVALVRVGFVVLIFFGGLGLLLYAAGWLLIPDEGSDQAIAGSWLHNVQGPQAWLGIALIAAALIVVADSTDVIRPDLVTAAVLVAVGVLLYRGDLGRRTRPPSPPSTGEPLTVQGETVTDTSTYPQTLPAPDVPGSAPPPAPPAPVPTPIPPAPRPPRERSILTRLTIAAALVTLGVQAMIDNLVPGIDVRGRHYVGAVVVVFGVGLLVGSVMGRARSLIVLGILAMPILLASTVPDIDINSEDVTVTPGTVAEIEGLYQIETGSLVVDLTEVDFAGETVEVDAKAEMGEVVVIVPDDVSVEAAGSVGIGVVELFGDTSGGLGGIRDEASRPGASGTLVVDVQTEVGRAAVTLESFRGTGPLFGSREIVVTDPADLSGDYSADIGNLTLDLSDLSLETARTVDVSVDAGEIVVYVPDDLSVAVTATVGAGDVILPDVDRSGFDLEETWTTGEDDPLLELDLAVDTGQITVEVAP
jgi:phage shock protein PspC (stress-responsive transcriptional regulator)